MFSSGMRTYHTLYDLQKSKVSHSKDVIFNEQKYGFDNSSERQESEQQAGISGMFR